MPFRFGKTIMTGMPVLHLRARITDNTGKTTEGWSACGIVSMWFDKDYTKSETRREADLYYSVATAINAYLQHTTPATPHQLHQTLQPAIRQKLQSEGLNGLTAGYGIALVDSAIIDATCRAHNTTFHKALRHNLLGLHPQFPKTLPTQPAAHIALRHTIGLGDPLTQSEITQPINDNLPQSLDQVITRYGTRYFKIKVNNDIPASIQRLRDITAVLSQHLTDYHATLDGNEAFPDMHTFAQFLNTCQATPDIQPLWQRILFFEQPVARHHALDPAIAPILKTITKPVIIDESDDTDTILQDALQLGYRGISAKNCKGIYRTLHSHATIHQLQAAGDSAILSSEDLTNQPIIPNHQDLCVAAALGITHSERNGHHFFRGFQYLPQSERHQALRDYPTLYENSPDHIPSLKFHNGQLSLNEINNAPGLGVHNPPQWDTMEPIQLPGETPAMP